jgi:toxin ParE1/3/4
MADYRLSPLAFEDIKGIFKYTLNTHGRRQAQEYRDGLKKCCQMLGLHKTAGESADDLGHGLRSFAYRSHTLYYLVRDHDVLIIRVLHQSMDARKHL